MKKIIFKPTHIPILLNIENKCPFIISIDPLKFSQIYQTLLRISLLVHSR
jgi:hypothetical protein